MADWFKTSLSPASSDPQQDDATDDPLPFRSRRSPVVCRHGCVASSQPLASSIGLDLLRKGANAADVAVAVAAALAVTEPCSTGLGGDAFALYYDSAQRKVFSVNASGKSPAELTLEKVRADYPQANTIHDSSSDKATTEGIDADAFRDSPLAVTVPGAAQGWQDVLERHGSGKFTLAQLVEPAAVLAEEGFPVGPVTSHHWRAGMAQIQKYQDPTTATKLPLSGPNGREGPLPGEIVHNPDMARVLRDLGAHGAKEGFYRGATGRAIVEALKQHGGCMTLQDLAEHESTFPEAISAQYRDCQLWQIPPNGQGIAGLIALTGLEHLEETGVIAPPLSKEQVGSADWYHALMEMMRLGFADNRAHVADPDAMKVYSAWLLNKERIAKRATDLFDPTKASIAGAPDASSCTVSFQVVDQDGNAISFVNSNFMGFGTGIVPKGCGFTLQNRGFGFTLDRNHPNALAPGKRPYHTIIPGMLTHADTQELYATISNMGGNMQPQGHMQLTVDMLAGGLDPQAAIDQPRFCIADGTQGGVASLESGVDQAVVEELKARGHVLRANLKGHDRSLVGRAQIIKKDRKTGVLWAGSDGRADGCAMGY